MATWKALALLPTTAVAQSLCECERHPMASAQQNGMWTPLMGHFQKWFLAQARTSQSSVRRVPKSQSLPDDLNQNIKDLAICKEHLTLVVYGWLLYCDALKKYDLFGKLIHAIPSS